MEEQKNKDKDKKETPEASVTAQVAVFDHILIVDSKTGEKIVNKRG